MGLCSSFRERPPDSWVPNSIHRFPASVLRCPFLEHRGVPFLRREGNSRQGLSFVHLPAEGSTSLRIFPSGSAALPCNLKRNLRFSGRQRKLCSVSAIQVHEERRLGKRWTACWIERFLFGGGCCFQNVIYPQWPEDLVQSEGIRGLRSLVFGTQQSSYVLKSEKH